MSFNKRFFTTGGIVASSGTGACTTDSADVFGDASGVALYTLDYDGSEASGLHDGTPDSAVEFGVAGVTNYGARFSSNTTGIVNTSLQLNSTAHSISLWVKPAEVVSGRWNTIFMSFFLGYPSGFLGKRSDQSTSFHYRTESGNELYFTLASADTWYHLVITRDSGGVDIYVDGSFVTSNSDSMGTYSNSSYEKTAIGSNPLYPAEYFKGDIDQVRIFNKVLSTDEIAALYNSGAGETACVYTCTTDTVDYPTTNVAYYKLDNSAEDETGSYDGTETNIEYRFGRFGQAAVFNGSSSKIDTGISSISSPFAVSMWINEDVLDSGIFFGNWNSTAADMYWQTTSDGRLRISIDGTSGEFFGTAGDVKINTWHHIAVTLSGGAYEVYLDGNSLGTSTTSVTTFSSGQNFMIGNSSKPSAPVPFDGKIDQVRIFSSALTSTQVEGLYNEKPCEDTSNFKTVLWEGTGATQYISNVGFDLDVDNGGDGGFVWIKGRSLASNHALFDTVRGAQKRLESDTTTAENSNYTQFSSFDANGFTLGNQAAVNSSGDDYVSWVWKAGGDAVSNTDGTITSQVSANQDAGFSIVTMNNASVSTVGHGLSQAPELIIWKSLTSNSNYWQVLAQAANGGNGHLGRLALQRTDAFLTVSSVWNNTQPTSTVFTLGTSCVGSGVAYCFHSVSGYSKIGSYTGDGNANKEITGLGFAPSFVMIKNAGDIGSWIIHSKPPTTTNPSVYHLRANSNAAQDSGANEQIDFDSDGFTLNGTGQNINHSDGDTYIYIAFK